MILLVGNHLQGIITYRASEKFNNQREDRYFFLFHQSVIIYLGLSLTKLLKNSTINGNIEIFLSVGNNLPGIITSRVAKKNQ